MLSYFNKITHFSLLCHSFSFIIQHAQTDPSSSLFHPKYHPANGSNQAAKDNIGKNDKRDLN